MPERTSASRRRSPAASSAAGSAAKSPGASDTPSLRFFHSQALREETLAVLDALEAAENPRAHAKALAALVGKLTESGLDYYFMRPLEEARAGLVLEKTARLGIGGATRMLGPLLGNVLGRLDGNQLRAIAAHIRHLMT